MCFGLGDFMAVPFKDPHPAYNLCYGRNCSKQSICDVCVVWEEDQWLHFSKVKALSACEKAWKSACYFLDSLMPGLLRH